MGRLDRYIFSTAAVAFLGVVVVLAGMIWATQALRQLDLVTSQGQTILAFIAITSLTMPTLVLVIAPAALFIATAYTLLKLNGDSEIVVMAAAGMGPWRLLRPLILLAILVSLFCSSLAVHVVPASLTSFREQVTKVRADVVSFVAQPGRFVNLTQGLVFHVRERSANGVMRGIFINDAREKEVSTYLADRGQIVESKAGIFLVLENGSIHRRGGDLWKTEATPQPTPEEARAAARAKLAAQNAGGQAAKASEPAAPPAAAPAAGDQKQGRSDSKAANSSVVEFQRYAFDLSSLAPDNKGVDIKPMERPLTYVMNPPPEDMYVRFFPGRYREELHKRLSAGLYPMAFFAIAAAALAQPRTTRQSRGAALTAIIPAMGLVQIGNFAIAGQLKANAAAVPLIYALPVVTVIICAMVLQGWIRLAPPAALTAFIDSIRARFSRRAAA
ncbi:lipopolysaccharide export system permease protein [Xanthobacter sp. SG618]|uniref:LptF/LptG family permease n=1 Tax=Xanthobacter sp. SG618 TaxID=2587121 RepID=UPI00145C93BA|nr:LptF/LptG family permease [Xanthobacter sp. SG618]NMN60351.1 lipopolysaccharide export system permease protein [Xanthobacter sp. SG618]